MALMKYRGGSVNLKNWEFVDWGALNGQVAEACAEALNNTMQEAQEPFATLDFRADGSLLLTLVLNQENLDEEPEFTVPFDDLLRYACQDGTKEDALKFLASIQASLAKVIEEVQSET